MSEELKPALINLRVFRIQKKTMSGNLDTSAEESPDVQSSARKRIIVIPDSDSDCEVNTTPVTVNGTTNSSAVSTTSTNSTVSTNITTTPTNGYTHVPRKPKTPGVIEKEQKVKYLLSKYPEAPGFEAYDMLSGVNFILPIADRKMAEKYGSRSHESFENWQKAASSAQPNRTGSASTIRASSAQSNNVVRNDVSSQQSNGVSSEQTNGMKRKEPVNRFQAKMQKVKRRKVDQDDDSNDSGDGAYKDSRVFDSDEDSDVEISNELTGDKKQVLEFMQTATPNELQLMASCSKKKVDAIVACRPFENWIDMVEKFKQYKNLSADLLNKAQEVLMTRNNIKQLMKKCTAIATQLERAVRADVRVKQKPSNMSEILTLTNYQLIGLNWLCVLHEQGVNGILADEMGLGKTVQVISFLAHLKEKNIARNTHLVVVPSSTLENWQNEFEKWCPDLKVLLYYGSIDERRQLRFRISEGKHNEFDVILTTYTMVSSTSEEKRMFRVTPMHYVVFDEAHMLKNMNTQRYESLIRIKAAKRILLTGTPLQNNLLELMSLLIFVMPNIFSEKADDLKSLFQKTTKGKVAENEELPQFEREQIQQAKRIMKPFLLRRLKRDVLQDLPKKTDHMLKIQMVPTQEEYYVNLVASFKEAGNSGSGAYNGVTMMSDLRKLSNHPLLLRYHYQYEDLPELAKKLAADPDYKDTVEQYIIDDLACMSDFEIHQMSQQYTCLNNFKLPENLILRSGKFLFLDKKLQELKDGGHRVLIFSQYVIMLDVMEEYLKIRQHSYMRLDGSTPVPIRQQLIDEYTADNEIFIFLLSTRAGGLGINLTAADTVIIHDIDFNPYNDKQAEDRCHRMGQTRPVDVYRLISKGTIEEGMWQLTQEKLKLEKEITSEERDENTDVIGVVNLLSSALGIDSSKATNLVSPKKKL